MSPARVEGMDSFRRGLHAMHAEWPKALADTNKAVGEVAAKWSRDEASSMGGIWARAKSAIGGTGNAQGAYVSVLPSAVDRMAPVAFWGKNKRSGWYAHPRYRNSPPQHPPWIGKSWDHGVAGQGPYAINNAIAKHSDELLEEYGNMLDVLAAAAFPNGIPSPIN